MSAPPDLSAGLCVGWPSFTELEVHEQIAICKTPCPVRVECGLYGIEGETTYWMDRKGAGPVYGGLSPREQNRIRKLRKGAE